MGILTKVFMTKKVYLFEKIKSMLATLNIILRKGNEVEKDYFVGFCLRTFWAAVFENTSFN